jgi:hypothetical protein
MSSALFWDVTTRLFVISHKSPDLVQHTLFQENDKIKVFNYYIITVVMTFVFSRYQYFTHLNADWQLEKNTAIVGRDVYFISLLEYAGPEDL